jgi:hypothetical protein
MKHDDTPRGFPSPVSESGLMGLTSEAKEESMPRQSLGDRVPATVRLPRADMVALDRLTAARGGNRGQVIVEIVQHYLKSVDLESLSHDQEALPIPRAS